MIITASRSQHFTQFSIGIGQCELTLKKAPPSDGKFGSRDQFHFSSSSNSVSILFTLLIFSNTGEISRIMKDKLGIIYVFLENVLVNEGQV